MKSVQAWNPSDWSAWCCVFSFLGKDRNRQHTFPLFLTSHLRFRRLCRSVEHEAQVRGMLSLSLPWLLRVLGYAAHGTWTFRKPKTRYGSWCSRSAHPPQLFLYLYNSHGEQNRGAGADRDAEGVNKTPELTAPINVLMRRLGHDTPRQEIVRTEIDNPIGSCSLPRESHD